jgi:hypothetical protein
MLCEMRPECLEKFKALDDFRERWKADHDEMLIIKTKVENLIESMRGLTRAIWSFTAAVLLLLAGFVVWYIQLKG